MATQVKRISIRGYKSIRELEDFELRPLNVLIGANGAGKSNLLSFFDLVSHIADERLELFVGQKGGAATLLHFGPKVTESLSFHLILDDDCEYHARLTPTISNRLTFSEEKLAFRLDDGRPKDYFSNIGSAETAVLSKTMYGYATALIKLKNWRIYHFDDTTDLAPVKQNADIHDNHFLKSDAKNLAAVLYLLLDRHSFYYERIVNTIRLAAPFFDGFVLLPMSENPQRIRLQWRDKGSRDPFDISLLSDGTLRFICLATLLLQPVPPPLIIIDEPELGLHPSAITLLAEMLQSAATRTQVIVSTQSVSLINHFQLDDIVVVDREDNQSVFRRHSADELAGWLEDYSLGEIWEKNLIGGRP
jgi:predicted ATPase